MKKFISIASVLGLLLAHSVSADIISPGPVASVAYKVGLPGLASFISQFGSSIFITFVVIFIALFITRKIEKRIKEKKNKDNVILK